MRKVVLGMMTTLNGRLDDPGAWVNGVDDEQYAEIDRAYGTFDTILVGTTTYEEMLAYWPNAGTNEEEFAGASGEITRSMAHKMNTYKKFVLSHTSQQASLAWNNAEQVLVRTDEDLVAFVRRLKAQPGRDIHLAGGASLAQTFIRLGLVDEYHFFVYPVVSAGAQWFDQVEKPHTMELVSATAYDNGVIGMYYKAARTAG